MKLRISEESIVSYSLNFDDVMWKPRIEEVNSLATSVCESMFIAIYTTQKIQLNMQETGAGSGSIKHIVV